MKHKYKPGDIFVIQHGVTGNFTDELIIIVEPEEANYSGAAYKVYNQTYNMFMDRTQMFLDMFYRKVG
jgi:hypothetical protein